MVVALTVCLIPVAASAHFERLVTSSRRVALGGASISVVDDATATAVNPAALVQVPSWSVSSTYDRPYGIADVDESFAAAAVRFDRAGALGLSWHRLALRGVMSEDLFTLAYARDIIRTSEDASLSLGANVDVARVSESERFDADATALTGGASVLLRPFPVIGIAYAVRSVTGPSLDLLDGGGETKLERTHAWGFSYWWHRSVSLSFEWEKEASTWRSHVGVEVELTPNLEIRSGVGRGSAAGGIGVEWGGITVDAGFASHEYLGSSYIVTVGYSPETPDKPYAQSP